MKNIISCVIWRNKIGFKKSNYNLIYYCCNDKQTEQEKKWIIIIVDITRLKSRWFSQLQFSWEFLDMQRFIYKSGTNTNAQRTTIYLNFGKTTGMFFLFLFLLLLDITKAVNIIFRLSAVENYLLATRHLTKSMWNVPNNSFNVHWQGNEMNMQPNKL